MVLARGTAPGPDFSRSGASAARALFPDGAGRRRHQNPPLLSVNRFLGIFGRLTRKSLPISRLHLV
jgi:hypothetical protein